MATLYYTEPHYTTLPLYISVPTLIMATLHYTEPHYATLPLYISVPTLIMATQYYTEPQYATLPLYIYVPTFFFICVCICTYLNHDLKQHQTTRYVAEPHYTTQNHTMAVSQAY